MARSRDPEVSRHLLRVQEEERKRISRELHNETGQGLMVLRMHLEMLAAAPISNNTIKERIQEATALLDLNIEGLRRTIGRLSPRVLEEMGLLAAIRKEARDLSRSSFEATRVISKEFPGTRTMFLTMYEDEEYLLQCLDAGASGCILKDVPAPKLVNAVHEVALGRKYLSPQVLAN